MATTITSTAKKPGPPVPPRPLHTITATHAAATAASLLKTQRESLTNATTHRMTNITTTATTTSSGNTKITVAASTNTNTNTAEQQHHPIIHKKPIQLQAASANTATANAAVAGGAIAGRTVVYKSPTMNLEKTQEVQQPRVATSPDKNSAAATPRSVRPALGASAHKPPLKLRKAPDVPTAKPNLVTKATSFNAKDMNGHISNGIEVNLSPSKKKFAPLLNETTKSPSQAANNNVVVLKNTNGVNLNRHHSMGSPKPTVGLKDTRLSLGKVDFEKVGLKVQLDQLQTAQPLPKPRKIVKMPVATMDVDDVNSTNSSNSTGIFRRSKTTLDNLASRANVTTINTGNSSNGFLSGKTVEIKNNLKNVAERLFSEIIVNQHKQSTERATIITKHERAIQHQALLEQDLELERQRRLQQASPHTNVTVVSTGSPTTRININGASSATSSTVLSPAKFLLSEHSVRNSMEKKNAFHEILISELAAMRAKSSSMENLQVRGDVKSDNNINTNSSNVALTTITQSPSKTTVNTKSITPTHQRRNSLEEDHERTTDTDDVDADNIEDAEGDAEDDLSKTLTTVASSNNTPRKRSPSGCSSDSSPYGTERSARIRTSDWIEVGDNGKQVTLTSCHISLEDSGLEDEERMDEMSSSGVGDSWDSVKEAEHVKRGRSVKRVMSITDLPPLPKSLSGINKMLGSDSGLISDADANLENTNTNNNNDNISIKLDSQNDNNNNNNNNSNTHSNLSNNNNNNNNSNDDNNNDQSITEEINANESETTDLKLAASENATSSAIITTTTTTITTGTSTGCTLDKQLAILKKEMYGLRQLDLSLLSQLWVLNDSIQEFRVMIEEQDDEDAYSRTPSSYDSASSEEDDIGAIRKRTDATEKVITTQPKLQTNNEGAQYMQTTELNISADRNATQQQEQELQQQQQQSQKPVTAKPVSRMRSAPPPPPTNHHRKAAAPPRPT